MASNESPAPPQTATRDTSRSGSPAARTPVAVGGNAASRRATKVRSGSGFGSLPIRPNPLPTGGGTSAKMSNAGSS
ncbi:Uncharacterised protein [Mycobacterium tuberculosis]|nr:Uncharacterised protein [Mycobacterium tuberculosis]